MQNTDSRIAGTSAGVQCEYNSESSPVFRTLQTTQLARSSTRRPLTFDSWPLTDANTPSWQWHYVLSCTWVHYKALHTLLPSLPALLKSRWSAAAGNGPACPVDDKCSSWTLSDKKRLESNIYNSFQCLNDLLSHLLSVGTQRTAFTDFGVWTLHEIPRICF